jgi:hypothetical protein
LTISNPYTSDPVYQNIDDAYFDYFNNKYNQEVPELKTFDWLMKNSKKYDIVLAGTKTNTGSYQWWHFIYKKQEKKEEVVVVAETTETKSVVELTNNQKFIENYITKNGISFFTELMSDVNQTDDEKNKNHIYMYASDEQLERRKNYLSENISRIYKITDWFNRPAPVEGFETLRQEEERYSFEKRSINSELESRILSRLEGTFSNPIQ